MRLFGPAPTEEEVYDMNELAMWRNLQEEFLKVRTELAAPDLALGQWVSVRIRFGQRKKALAKSHPELLIENVLSWNIADLFIHNGTRKALYAKKKGMTFGELSSLSIEEVVNLPDIGEARLKDIKQALAIYHLELGMSQELRIAGFAY